MITVKNEVIERCNKMIEKQLTENQSKLFLNRREINRLAKEQRVMKSQIGMLFEMKNDFKKLQIRKEKLSK
jgi:ABC-type phosphate transport system ATPase subunit